MPVLTHKDLVEKAVKRFQIEAERKQKSTPQPRRVITISRQAGSEEREIVGLLKQWLDWPVWDKEILDVLAGQSHLGYQAKMFEAVDEKVHDEIESMMHFMFGHIDKNAYLYLLPKAIFLIARNDAIIIGRGAHLLLPDALKIRIKASFPHRVDTVMKNEGISRKEAQNKIRHSDTGREDFLKELSRRLGKQYAETKNHLHYDLEINTDSMSAEEAALLIFIAAVKRFDLKTTAEKIFKNTSLL